MDYAFREAAVFDCATVAFNSGLDVFLDERQNFLVDFVGREAGGSS
jgi:hypothetical protein